MSATKLIRSLLVSSVTVKLFVVAVLLGSVAVTNAVLLGEGMMTPAWHQEFVIGVTFGIASSIVHDVAYPLVSVLLPGERQGALSLLWTLAVVLVYIGLLTFSLITVGGVVLELPGLGAPVVEAVDFVTVLSIAVAVLTVDVINDEYDD